jgi:crossover junction endodeoxyribonuclease RuvC
MIIVGIDPGQSGAIAWAKGKKVKVTLMPTLNITKTKKELDGQTICKLLKKHKVDHVFIEKVHSMPSQGVTSTFTFAEGYGILIGICMALELPFTLVTPQTWKKAMCTGMPKGSKDVSIIIAKRLWPKINLLPTPRCKKESDGMADALCIAEYGKRLLTGESNV